MVCNDSTDGHMRSRRMLEIKLTHCHGSGIIRDAGACAPLTNHDINTCIICCALWKLRVLYLHGILTFLVSNRQSQQDQPSICNCLELHGCHSCDVILLTFKTHLILQYTIPV